MTEKDGIKKPEKKSPEKDGKKNIEEMPEDQMDQAPGRGFGSDYAFSKNPQNKPTTDSNK